MIASYHFVNPHEKLSISGPLDGWLAMQTWPHQCVYPHIEKKCMSSEPLCHFHWNRSSLHFRVLKKVWLFLFWDLHVLKKSKRDKWKYSNLVSIVISPTSLCVMVTQADGTLYPIILDPGLSKCRWAPLECEVDLICITE